MTQLSAVTKRPSTKGPLLEPDTFRGACLIRPGSCLKSLTVDIVTVFRPIPNRVHTMPQPEFQPGCRLSKLDVGVLVCGTIGAVAAWSFVWWVGFVIAFVVAHFFLFCNVVRMARPLELIWAATFVMLAGATVVFETPGWMIAIAGSLVVTVLCVCVEIRKPSYHGIAWRRLNPMLPQWWNDHVARKSSPSNRVFQGNQQDVGQ